MKIEFTRNKKLSITYFIFRSRYLKISFNETLRHRWKLESKLLPIDNNLSMLNNHKEMELLEYKCRMYNIRTSKAILFYSFQER